MVDGPSSGGVLPIVDQILYSSRWHGGTKAEERRRSRPRGRSLVHYFLCRNWNSHIQKKEKEKEKTNWQLQLIKVVRLGPNHRCAPSDNLYLDFHTSVISSLLVQNPPHSTTCCAFVLRTRCWTWFGGCNGREGSTTTTSMADQSPPWTLSPPRWTGSTKSTMPPEGNQWAIINQ